MNILLTGATGGIGQKILKALTNNENNNVFILSRFLHKDSIGEKFRTRVGDLLDERSLKAACDEIDLVIHAAGLTHSISRKRYFEINLEGTKNLLKACHINKVKKIIFLSSRTASMTGGAYAESKFLAEKEIEKTKMDYVILSLSEVYGIEKGEAISSLIRQVKNKKFIFIPGNGSYSLCPVYVDDVVWALLKVIELEVKNKKYLVSGPKNFSFEVLVDLLAQKYDKKIKKIKVPIVFLRLLAFMFPQFLIQDQIDRLLVKKDFDISLLKQDLGFSPRSLF